MPNILSNLNSSLQKELPVSYELYFKLNQPFINANCEEKRKKTRKTKPEKPTKKC